MVPKVTVAIPTYNRATLLKQCLETILRQTFRDFEVIVSDNCSPDATPEAVRAFNDPRIRYYRNESNLGVFPNMNRCIDRARGQYIAIVHDDDLFAPQFIEQEARLLDEHPSVGMVHCAAYETDPDGVSQRLIKVYPETRIMNGKEVFVRCLRGHNVLCSTVMARTSLYRTIGGYEPRYKCADYHMWLRMALHTDVGYIATPLAGVRVHPGRLSSALEPHHWFDEFVEIFEQGVKWGEASCPELLGSKAGLLRRVAHAQGRRFLLTALAAAVDRDLSTARGCSEVLRRLQVWGLPKVYALAAQMSCNPASQLVLSPVRQICRLRAKWNLPPRGW